MAIVMFYGDEPAYYLTSIKRDANGRIVSGWVENGAWDLHVTEVEHQALRHDKVVNSCPTPPDVHEVEVPKGNGDYNDVISRAVEKYKAQP